MASLDRNLRRDLEKTVRQARRVAETGAAKAVAQLGVGDAEVPRHLSADQRALRNRLRAHGRQLGDRRDTRTGAQDTAHLIQECAYEHWHRMLFARFLAEADLLIEPESGVAISLAEVQELARAKATDWLEQASGYAKQMLPQIFRKDDPVLQIALPPETRSELEDLLKGLPRAVFGANDSLGWVYQYWQADNKDAINESETKIGADELAAVTQLFTEDYMVLFLLHNTLGAWWAGKVLATSPNLTRSAKSEDELRAACKVGDVEWRYLRFVRDKAEHGSEGPWRPAAGAFEGWPKTAKDITVLDPCMGSGHFLVLALPILVAIRMAEEGLPRETAVEAVLRDNIFGLEIDQRCTQIAAFNLAFAAWRSVGYRPLPKLNLACSGLAIGVTKADWLRLAEKAVTAADPAAKRDLLGVEKNLLTVGLEERVKNGLAALYDVFAKAPWLGSLINPRRASGDIFNEGFDKLGPLLTAILASADTDEAREMAVAAQGMAKAAELLGRRFTLVATNVPYLGRGKQDDFVKNYCELAYPRSKADLSTCFVERCITYCVENGTIGLVTPQNWLFLSSYAPLRRDLLKRATWNAVAKLGPAAFEDMNWWAANTVLLALSNNKPAKEHALCGFDVSPPRDPQEKAAQLKSVVGHVLLQAAQEKNPDSRLLLSELPDFPLLEKYASSYQGISPADFARYGRTFWELSNFENWRFWQGTVTETITYGGRELVLWWNDDLVRAVEEGTAFIRGEKAWGCKGVVVRQMRHLPCTLYTGEAFDTNCAVIVPSDPALVPALWAFCSSDEFPPLVRELDQKTNVTNATLVKVPFDIDRWKEEAARLHPSGLPSPASNDPTQWLFGGNPNFSTTPLVVGVARLIGYRWPRQTGLSFVDCPAADSDGLETHADDDGIVCLTATKGKGPAHGRLATLLADCFGAEWSAAKLANLLADLGFAGKTLDDWLRDGCFAQHCALFHQRPFVWHIWDGRRDGFHALVNYHRLAAPEGGGRRTLEKLIYSYLGDWIDGQRAEQTAGVEGADARLAHAEHLRAELIKILEGEPPYDIFVRWKPLHEQPIGWEPDINDGVRINIRPFMTAKTLNSRGTNACILRTTPRIKWDKDRGKEPKRDKADYPWFWGWDGVQRDFAGRAEFDGNRWNDLHYSRAVKQAARERHRAKTRAKS